MKFSHTLILSFVSIVAAAPAETKKYLELALVPSLNRTSNLARRNEPYPADLEFMGYYYDLYLEIGSDKQGVRVELDTGSADLWVCESNGAGDYGYNPDTSKSAYPVGHNFSITYVDETTYLGPFYKDTVSFGEDGNEALLHDFQFAVIPVQEKPVGLLGIAPVAYEATPPAYPNFIQSLKDQGLISSRAFSIYLNIEEKFHDGSIVFGGIDKAKFKDDLVALPVTNKKVFGVNVKSFTVNGDTVDINEDASFDTGTTHLSLTQNFGDALFNQFGTANYNDVANAYLVDSKDGYDQPVTLNFDGTSVDLSLMDMYSDDVTDDDGNSYGPGFYIYRLEYVNYLGDSFLKNLYCVYNYETNELSIAPVVITDKTNIVAI